MISVKIVIVLLVVVVVGGEYSAGQLEILNKSVCMVNLTNTGNSQNVFS